MPIPELYDYQADWVEGLRESIRNGARSPLGVLPTGGGKTVCFSFLSGRIRAAGKITWIMVHRDELVDQVSETLASFGIPHGFIAAGKPYDSAQLVQVVSVFSLIRKLDRVLFPHYVIPDEAHHCIAESTWGKIVIRCRDEREGVITIGVTATPIRLSGEGLGEMFDDMIVGPTVQELMDRGRLSRYRMFAPKEQFNREGIARQGGELKKSEVADRMSGRNIVGDAIAHYREHCDQAPGVAFCISVEEAEKTAQRFRDAGYNAISIDGKMNRSFRREVVRDFQLGGGRIHVLTSCSLVDEGFDCPGIVAAFDLNPTESLARCLQRWGRTLRVFKGKDYAYIFDHAGNSVVHGLPNDDREWSLVGKLKTKAGVASARQCDKCLAISAASARFCSNCKTEFPAGERPRMVESVDGELEEIEIEKQRKAAEAARKACRTVEELEAYAVKQGFKNPKYYARKVMQGRQRMSHSRGGLF